MRAMDTTLLVQKIAVYKSVVCFTDDYVKNTPQEDREEEGLGIVLATWAEWDGLKLMRVFAFALEDANFHDEAELVQEMIGKLTKED